MIAAPPLTRNLDSLPGFFRELASESGLPLIVQDDPASTGVSMPLSILRRSLEESGARTVKLEDPPTALKIRRLLASDETLKVFGGAGGLYTLSELLAGSCGTMTGFAYPEALRAVRESVWGDDPDRALSIFTRFLPLIALEAQPGVGLAVRKEILRRRNALPSNRTRSGISLDDDVLREIDLLMVGAGLRVAADRLDLSRA
jgi:4-hydroxy-tetrahydrodipicolinate synthase